MMTEDILDNIIWHALSTRQAAFATGGDGARKFIDDVGPLAGFPAPNEAGYKALSGLVNKDGVLAVFLDAPYHAQKGWEEITQAPLVQMIYRGRPPLLDDGAPVEPLSATDSAAMVELATLTRPGPFGPRTHELGSFFGVRDGNAVVAMAGERMKVPGYTEVSAVCTHPDHLGRGYASAVMRRVMSGIIARGETPFLHARGDNDRAIGVYQRLGFVLRRSGHFAVLKKL